MDVAATVTASISLTAPATLDLGAGYGGTDLSAAITVHVASSDAFTLTAAAGDFVSGANTIPAAGNVRFGSTTYTGGAYALGSSPDTDLAVWLALPATAHAGTYHSTFTFTASN
jgi:hypothetical protein